MPATPTDIAAGTREVVLATWESATIAARYPAARDASVDPSPAFFDSVTDAQTVADARGALIGTERRRFSVNLGDVVWPDLSAGVPQARLVDAEQAADLPTLIARLEVDLEAGTTTMELFG